MNRANWRASDIGAYLVLVMCAAVCVWVRFYPGAVVVSGLALLQLAEAILHAFADAITEVKS
jgi:hypothetical protein